MNARSSRPRNPEGRKPTMGRMVALSRHKKTAAGSAAVEIKLRSKSGNVSGDQLGHLEHRNGLLATENGLQLVVRIDLRLRLLVLQAILLDVGPELLGQLGAGKWVGTNDSGESRVGCNRFHE